MVYLDSFAPFLVVVFSLYLLIALLVTPYIISYLERHKLFEPLIQDTFLQSKGAYYALTSGGGLLHYSYGTEAAREGRRKVLFCHGNSENMDSYVAALERFGRLGYDVWCVTYQGFIPRTLRAKGHEHDDHPTMQVCMANIIEAYSLMGDSNTIVVAFSIGGFVFGSVYDFLVPQPAQIVFLNTFASLVNVVRDKSWLPPWLTEFLVPWMQTKWQTRPPKHYKGRVSIVYSAHDNVTLPKHSYQLRDIFKESNPDFIELPYGDHRSGPIICFDQWTNSSVLLGPVLTPLETAHQEVAAPVRSL